MLNRFELKIASRYLIAQKKRFSTGLVTLFSFGGVVIGVWLLIFVLSIANGFEQEVKEQLIGKDAHFEVTRQYYLPMSHYDTLEQKISKFDNIDFVAPFIQKQIVLSSGSEFRGVSINGIDPRKSAQVVPLWQQIKLGKYRFHHVKEFYSGKYHNGIILGYILADYLGVTIGDKIYLYYFDSDFTSMTTLSPKVSVFVVSGIFESGVFEHDGNSAYIHLEHAQKALKMNKSVSGIYGKIKNLEGTKNFSYNLESYLGTPYQVLSWQQKHANIIKWMDYEKVIISLALGIIIIIASFNIVSSIVMNVNDKKREIGILRAMGASDKNILKIFLGQGFLIGIFGILIGLSLGFLSCWLQSHFGLINLPGDVYFVTKLPVQIEIFDIILIVIITLVLCLLAAFIPSLVAVKQKPLESIRYE